MNFEAGFTEAKLARALEIILQDFPFALLETLYITLFATLFACLIGLPLGMLLVSGDKGGVRPLPPLLMKIINMIINLLRSIPFLIMIMMVIPLTRLIIGKSIGTTASIVPLVVAAFPFVARLVEASFREVNPNLVETAQSMGFSSWQIMFRVMLPEAVPSLINNFTLAITTILGYTAMAAAAGGGGIGKLAISNGFNMWNLTVLYAAVVVLVIITQIFQSLGTFIATKSDKRLKH